MPTRDRGGRQPNVAPFHVQTPMRVQNLKFVAKVARSFTWPQEEQAAGTQAEVEQREYFPLDNRLQIDQQISSCDEIDTCKWCI